MYCWTVLICLLLKRPRVEMWMCFTVFGLGWCSSQGHISYQDFALRLFETLAGRPCEGQRDLDPLKARIQDPTSSNIPTKKKHNIQHSNLLDLFGAFLCYGHMFESASGQGVEHTDNKPKKPAATNTGWNWQAGTWMTIYTGPRRITCHCFQALEPSLALHVANCK